LFAGLQAGWSIAVAELFGGLSERQLQSESAHRLARRIKNYMRSKMSRERTSDLSQLAVERDVAHQLDFSIAS